MNKSISSAYVILISLLMLGCRSQSRNGESTTAEDNQEIMIEMKTGDPKYADGWDAPVGNDDGACVFRMETESSDKNYETGLEAGVSGTFFGVADGVLIQAGGCNFPENPMAKDSKKKFYQGIYRLVPTESGKWKADLIGELSSPTAYGLGVSTDKGLLLTGGTSAEKAFSEVWMVNVDSVGRAYLQEYPSLPVTLDNHAVANVGNKVFAGGGNADGKPSNRVFMLDLDNTDKGWQEISSFPGNPRVQPVMAGVRDAKGNDFIYLWGGFAGKSETREATLNTDGARYDLSTGTWETVSGPVDNEGEPVSTGGGAATVLADGRVVVTGGVNKDIFLEALRNQAPDYLEHPKEWYRFNPYIFVFDPKTEEWSIAGKTSETARAGAGMASTETGEILLSGGELKPRIRTSEIYRKKID